MKKLSIIIILVVTGIILLSGCQGNKYISKKGQYMLGVAALTKLGTHLCYDIAPNNPKKFRDFVFFTGALVTVSIPLSGELFKAIELSN